LPESRALQPSPALSSAEISGDRRALTPSSLVSTVFRVAVASPPLHFFLDRAYPLVTSPSPASYTRPMDGDLELLQSWQAGDDQAGERLFRRHYRSVLRFFHNKAGASAHDLVQRTFLACLEARARIRGDSSFRPFLFGIARNVLYDHYRLSRRDRDHLEAEKLSAEDLQPSPTSRLAEAREAELLLRGLRRIPLADQIVLEMYYWEGMRARELAETLELPENTVRTKIRRARLRLEAVIGDLSASPTLRQSTLLGIETWAAQVREGIGG